MGKKRVTLADVARHAGLSPTAVSLILNGRPSSTTRLSEDATRRARESAAELGYRPNAVARSLVTQESRTIGFLSDNIASSRFAGPMILGAMREARRRDHFLLITETEGSPETEIEAARTLTDRQVDSVLISGVRSREVEVPAPLRDVRHVMLNLTAATPAPHVLPDEHRGGRDVAALLLAAGHTRGIVVVGTTLASRHDPGVATAIRRRLGGIHDELAEHGLVPLAEIGHEPWEPEMAYAAVSELLQASVPVTALLCLNDRAAIGAYNACLDRGLSIPGDVSVIGFDGDEAALYLRPPLVTAVLPHEEMGRRAVALLFEEAPDEEVLVTMPLRAGGSVGPPGGGVALDTITERAHS